MTEQERAELEQAAKPQRWGSKERVALVAEVLRQKRMVRWLAEYLADAAAGSLHVHVRAHPDHGAALSDHLLSCIQRADNDGHGFADDFILHNIYLHMIKNGWFQASEN